MTEDGEEQAAAEELALAREELSAAGQLIDGGHPRIALARTYFAAFHAVRARLFREGLEPRSHNGVQYLWSTHFVKSGRYEPATARLLSRLQRYREEADYSRAFVADDQGARDELAEATALVDRIAAEITER